MVAEKIHPVEVVAWQPNFLGRASKSAQEATNLEFVAHAVACLQIVLLGTLKPSTCSRKRKSRRRRGVRKHRQLAISQGGGVGL